jgi:hypothetical protein
MKSNEAQGKELLARNQRKPINWDFTCLIVIQIIFFLLKGNETLMGEFRLKIET